MPYVNSEMRLEVEEYLPIPTDIGDLSTGQLNYMLTRLLLAWIGAPSYHRIAEAVGTVECAKLELYRRLAAPYEDKKMAENGDVYPGESA